MKKMPQKLVFLFLFIFVAASAEPLPRSTPEQQGISSNDILAFVRDAEAEIESLHSIMVVRHGQVVAEGWWSPYNAESPHSLYSLSKSFTSTAIGMLIDEGKLKLTDKVLSFFPEYAPAEPSVNLSGMRVRDLLIMSSGQQTEAEVWDSEEPWAKLFLEHPVPHWPGTHFRYNTPGSFMLSAIAHKLTGKTLNDYLQPRLFDPLGIKNQTWKTNHEGISIGGSGLAVRTEDIAKFGQLYLQKGRWGDQQLISKNWVKEATALQTSNGSDPDSNWQYGYGYQFWRCPPTNVYRGDGAFGQYCIVMPDQDAVIAITSGVKSMASVMDLVWKHFIPAMQPTALPADPISHQKLTAKLAGLVLPAQSGARTSPLLEKYSGQRYIFLKNQQALEALSIEPSNDNMMRVTLQYDGHEQVISCEPDTWQNTPLNYGTNPKRPYAASGAWTADDTYTLMLCDYGTPFTTTIHLQFKDDELHYNAERNVGFSKEKPPALIGKVASNSAP